MEYVKSMLGYGKMSPDLKKAIMRLEKDRQELITSPVDNVSAAPLDSDMLEWHCNILFDDVIYHLILFFPKEYPCISPSAEFVPQGFNYEGGAAINGRKGTKICLSIFSDFADIHSEWKDESHTGWSPGYTVQTVLLNVVSFLSELSQDRHGYNPYHKMCRKFVCSDCGHKLEKPFPPINKMSQDAQIGPRTVSEVPQTDEHKEALASRMVDYMSKERFCLIKPENRDQLFGYGVLVSDNPKNPSLISPCEFLTFASFNDMVSSLGQAQSVSREKLNFFLPMYISEEHGSMIRGEFERTMWSMAPALFPNGSPKSLSQIILKVIPNLMCSTVVQFSKGTVHTSDNSLEGYFALHRLFLWAMDTYPELGREVNQRLQGFVTNDLCRRKSACPDIGQWLMLLSVTGKYTWAAVSQAYLSENFNRNVMWYLKQDIRLADMNASMGFRLQRTFELTKVGRNLLAFQVAFLRIAKPAGMSRGDVLRRYEANLGFPSPNMVQELKNGFKKINHEVTRYDHWYQVIGVPVPTREQLNETLMESVKFANATEGYHFSNNGRRRR